MKDNTILSALKWRYATKKFDPQKKVSDKEINDLLECLRLSPSSYGLQPWKFLVISNPDLRAELQKHAYNQPQIVDASHLIVLCAKTTIDKKYVEMYTSEIARIRGIPRESLKEYEQMMTGFVTSHTPQFLTEWAKRQVYLALGILLESSALKGIDACPMEGFDCIKFDKVLKLESQGLASAVLCTVGYRSSSDDYAQAKKVRFETSAVVESRE